MTKFTRRIHFYHTTIHTKDGNVFQDAAQNNSDEFSTACEQIQDMAVADKTSKLIDNSESYRLVYFKKVGDHYEGKVAKYRDSHMLYGTESDDELLDMALEEGEKFVEVTHFIYSPTKHVLSFEYNQLGPRITAFMRYINTMRGRWNSDADLLISELIPHPSVIERLKDVKRIKQLAVGISADRIPTNVNQGNLLRGMDYIRGFTNAGMITVKLSAGTLSRGNSIIDPSTLMTSLGNEVDLGALGKASIEAVTDFGDETINLLDNDMVAIKKWNEAITTENFERWFSDILEAYRERRSLIDQSLRKNENDSK